jgi:branched-chain amino acid transport system substrate-binding protein
MRSRNLVRTAGIAVSMAVATAVSAQDIVKVGMVMPLTGPLAAAGQQVVAGARLYMKQKGETVAGRKIELIVKDDASSGETGKRLIQELIVNEKIDVIGGGLTADLLPSASLLTEAQSLRSSCFQVRPPSWRNRHSSSGRVARSPNPPRSWRTGRSRAA